MAIVTFDYEYFKELFPQFKDSPSESIVTDFFTMATEIIDNSDNSIFPYDPEKGIQKRKLILYFLTCHLLVLRGWGEIGQPGQLTNASQGSVSTAFSLPSISDGASAAWWYGQTPCGRSAWLIIRGVIASKSARYYKISNYHPFG